MSPRSADRSRSSDARSKERNRSRARTAVAVVLIALAITALPGRSARAALLDTVPVIAVQGHYLPGDLVSGSPTLVIESGTGLTLVNADRSTGHSLTSVEVGPGGDPLFESGVVRPASRTSVAGVEALVPGTYAFRCVVAEQMQGVLAVAEPSPIPAPPPVPKPEMPDLPERPERPDVPELPEAPPAPEIPEQPELPDSPELPGVPEVPEVPEPETPGVPEVPEVPSAPDVPEVPEPPGLPPAPTTPNVEETVQAVIDAVEDLLREVPSPGPIPQCVGVMGHGACVFLCYAGPPWGPVCWYVW